MPRYVIERDLPGAGRLSVEELQAIAQRWCQLLTDLRPPVHWVQSYVTGDKLYCVYIAPSEALVREHARRVGLPPNRISLVTRVLDPTTAEE